MNLEYLITYLEVIKSGSFSKVARKLSLSQPAISFQIQKLERDLGVRLIDRRQKKFTATEAGKRLLRFARSVERERARLDDELERLREQVTGKLVIAASTIPGEYIIPSILSEFKTRHPTVEIQVAVSDSLTVIADIESGNYEIGFCGIAPQGHGLESFKVAEDEILLLVFPGHPFARREEVSLTEIAGEALIFREDTSGTQRSVEYRLQKEGFDLTRCSPKLVLGTTQAVISAVEAGTGIAFVSSMAIKKSLALGLVGAVRIKGVPLRRDFFCIYRRVYLVSRLLEEFVAFVEARALNL